MARDFYPVPVRVRYAETDQMGVVHHSIYPVWFELARSELSRTSSLPYGAWEELGILLMVSELRCRYRRPARYDQDVTVWVRVAGLGSRRVVFEYAVTSQAGEVLAEGETRHVVVDRRTGRTTAIPERCKSALLDPVPLVADVPGRPGPDWVSFRS